MNSNLLVKLMDARRAATRRTIAAIPTEQLDFRPMPDMMSARELALHLVGNYSFLKAGLVDNDWRVETFEIEGSYPTTEAIVERFDAIYGEARNRMPSVSADAFDRRVKPFGAEQKVSSLVHGIGEHETQHRGQLQVYLRLMGVKPPSMYGE